MERKTHVRTVLTAVAASTCVLILPLACGGSRDDAVVQSQSTTPNESASTTQSSSAPNSLFPSPEIESQQTSSTTAATVSQDIEAEGESIRADKLENATKNGYEPFNAGDYAYPSEPIDITAPGDYETLVGPIDDWVEYDLYPDRPVSPDNSPAAWVIKQRDDQTFDVRPFEIHVVTKGGQRFLAVKFTVTEQSPGFEPYPGYVFWLY